MKKFCLFVVLSFLLITLAGCGSLRIVRFAESKGKIDVLVGNKQFTSYVYDEKYLRPMLWPIYSPSGVVLTRNYPMVEGVEGESQDHPHHTGLFFGYGNSEIADSRFWVTRPGDGVIRHMKVIREMPGPGKGTLSTVINWVSKKGKVALEEQRKMTFIVGQDEYAIDFCVDLIAQDETVVFKDTKEGLFAIRVAPFLREASGSDWVKGITGTAEYFNSNGDKTEKNVWGKRSRWVALQGNKDGKIIGIAIFNHPESENYPTYWHTRGYGLFAANPLAQYDFEKGRKVENPQHLNFTLTPGEKARFRFLIVFYEGPRTAEQLEKQFLKYARPKVLGLL